MNVPEDRARILVVENDVYIQALIRYCLKTRFDIEIVGRFDDALRVAAQQPFDVFVLDINLGEKRTGIDLMKALQQLPANATTPAIACTADGVPDTPDYFVQYGFHQQVCKPFSREELIGAIDAVLAAKERVKHAFFSEPHSRLQQAPMAAAWSI